MKLAAAVTHRTMQPFCRQFHRLIWLVGLSLPFRLAGLAQTDVPAPLPPDAQAAVNKGIIASEIAGLSFGHSILRRGEEAGTIRDAIHGTLQ